MPPSLLSVLAGKRRQWLRLGALLCALVLLPGLAGAQTRPLTRPTGAPRRDTAVTRTAPRLPATDKRSTTTVADTTIRLRPRRAGGIETTIKYSARDSIRLDAPGQTAYLYGDAKIDYGQTNMQAERVSINYGSALVEAEGAPDSTGELVGTPIFIDKGEQYEAKKIAYNYKTKKGKITEAITKQGDGYIHAEAVRRQNEKELYGLHGRYTTCDLPNPHFYIAASRMKVVPGEKIICGPFNLVVGDIPTPLGFLFGFFPTPRKRASGILIPTFGESTTQGFYLTNGGYYWAASPSVGVKVTGDIYSLGGFTVRGETQYIKRYRYNGSFQASWQRFPANQATQEVNLNPAQSLNPGGNQINIQWRHSPTPRPGGGRFSADVNAGSTSFYRGRINTSISNYISNTFQSSVNYSKQSRRLPINYTVALQQSQSTGGANGQPSMDFTLPSASLGLARQTPLHWLAERTSRKVFDNLTFSYQVAGSHRFSTVRQPGGFGGLANVENSLDSARNLTLERDGLLAIIRNGSTSVNHTMDLGLGTYSVAHVNLSPGVSYGEAWTFQRYSYTYNPNNDSVRVDTTRGLYRVYQYQYSLNANTRLYATTVFPKSWKVQVLRTTLNPSVGYSYSPDYGGASFGYYQTGVRVGRAATSVRDLPRYAGVPGGGRASNINFGLSSVVEMKIKPGKNDTTTTLQKITLLNQATIRGSYNLLADSLKLSPLQASVVTRPFGLFDVNFDATLNPYQRDTLGRSLNRYLIDGPGFRLTRLDGANLNVRFAFNPAERKLPVRQRTMPTPGASPPAAQPSAMVNDVTRPYDDYIPFELPWTFSAQYTVNYRAPAPTTRVIARPITQSLQVSGSLKLTQKWAVQYGGSYDFTNKKVATPTLSITRDLHCWQLSVYWIPTGPLQSYNVTLNVLNPMLRDLKLTRNRSWYNR